MRGIMRRFSREIQPLDNDSYLRSISLYKARELSSRTAPKAYNETFFGCL